MLQDLHYHLQDSKLLPPRSKLLLAVSGGVDSVTLLDLLTKLQGYYGWQIAVAHLDHKVRNDSVQDAMLVGELADRLGHKYYLGQLDGKETREAALRKARYAFLGEIADSGKYEYIVTAHHGDDRIETSILNSIRGAGREGMAAMRSSRDKLRRPLMPFNKADLLVHAGLNKLEYREDSTNVDLGYRRNLVRHELLPLGALYYKNFHKSFAASLDRLEALNDRIAGELAELLNELATEINNVKIEIDTERLARLPEIVQINVLSFASKQLLPQVALSQKNLAQALNFVLNAGVGASTHLASGLHLLRGYDTVIITSVQPRVKTSQNLGTTVLKSTQPFSHGLFRVELKDHPIPTKLAQAIIQPQPIYVRFWQPGDRVQPVGMSGSKKLQDVFSDAKVPRQLRSHWPVVVNARNEVVWLPALVQDRRSLAVSNSPDSYQLICEVR